MATIIFKILGSVLKVLFSVIRGIMVFCIPLGVPAFTIALTLHLPMSFGLRVTLALAACLWWYLIDPIKFYRMKETANLVQIICYAIKWISMNLYLLLRQLFVPRI